MVPEVGERAAAGGRQTFVGRLPALARLRQALAQARAGRPQLALVEGPGGIGKTALVRRFLSEAEVGCVLRASGDEDEASLEFGVLTQLVAHAPAQQVEPAGRGDDDGFTASNRSVDPLVAGAALVDLLGQLQRSDAVVLVVDDAQWADRPSLQALTFALRRLRVDRVLAVVVARDVADPRIPDGLRRLVTGETAVRVQLDGLDVDELRDLVGLLGGGPLSARGAARLRVHTGGSPLHARALLDQLPAGAFDDATVPLPAPRSFAMLVAARLAGSAPEAERLVAAASVLGMHVPVELAAAVAGVEDPLSALEQAMASGLLEEHPAEPGVCFPHPLVQAAVYRQLGPARRAVLHLRAAECTEDEAVRLRHRARAARGPDAALAGDLARLGRRQATAGAWVSAAEHLAGAARLTPDRADHEQLTLEMVECQLLAGDVGDPAPLTTRLRAFAPTGWRSYTLARLAYSAGALGKADALLRDAWQRCDPDSDPVLGARIAGHFALLRGAYMRGEEQIEWAERALRLAPEQTATDMIWFLRLNATAMSAHATIALDPLPDLPEPTVASAAELEEILGRGVLRLHTDDLEGALRDLGGVLAASHDRSATFRWVAAGFLSVAEFRAGRWDDAFVHGELALSVATDADQAHLAVFCHEVATLVPAARGEWAAAETHLPFLDAAATSGFPTPIAMAALTRAHLARARGAPETVVAAYEPLLRPELRYVIEQAAFSWWLGPLFDALIAVGDHDRAEGLLGPYEARAAERDVPSALAVAGRARGNLAAARGDPAAAEHSFETALAHAGRVDAPFDRALLQFAYGRFLRREGKRTRAGEQLYAAREVFARLGARPDLERCEHELAACGLSTGPRKRRDVASLTPQELAVARLVVRGLTNRQVARELVISVKTVEYHLGHVYAKLEITSRSLLAARLAGNQT